MIDAVAKLALPLRWLLIAGIAYTVATSVLYFVSPPATAPVAPASGAPTSAAAPAADLNTLLASNLFGSVDQNAAPEVRDEPAVATTLPLELLAVWVAENADNSVATIAQRGRQGENYLIGDDVPGNATLVEVHSNHVVLRRAGVRETLHFPSPAQSLARRASVPQDDYGFDGGFPDVLDDVPMDDMPDFGEPDEIPPELEAQEAGVQNLVDEYRQELEQNPEQTLEELGVVPVEDGTAQGYRIGDLAHSPYLSQTGLQPGDVILSVNGRPVGDLSQDRLELDNVLAEGSARLEVQRGNRRFFVTASLR